MRQVDEKNKIIELYVLLAVDLCVMVLSYMLAIFFRYGSLSFFRTDQTHRLVILCLIISCIIYSFFIDWNRDFIKRGYFVEITAITKYNMVVLVVAALLLFLFQRAEVFSRLVFIYFAIKFSWYVAVKYLDLLYASSRG